MKQSMKNEYYKMVACTDYHVMELIDSVFLRIDNFLLVNPYRDNRKELLAIISCLEEVCNPLYLELKCDIERCLL